MNREQSSKFLFLDEVATLLRLPVTTVRAWARTGRLPAVRVGRRYIVRGTDLDVLLTPGDSSGKKGN